MWNRSQSEYRERYVLGIEREETEQLRLGKRIATALEKPEAAAALEDRTERQLLELFPSYPLREFEVKADCEGVPILGKFDGFENAERIRLGEYKTGRKWTQSRVDADGQLTWYALCIFLAFKRLPDEIKLTWAETDFTEDGLRLTGRIQTFTTKRTLADVAKMVPDIKRVWSEIGEMYSKEINQAFL